LPKGREHVPVLVYNIAKELGVKTLAFGLIKVQKPQVQKERLTTSLCGNKRAIYSIILLK